MKYGLTRLSYQRSSCCTGGNNGPPVYLRCTRTAGTPAKIGLKIRYNTPTPKMYVKALRDSSKTKPRSVQSRKSLQRQQRIKRERLNRRNAQIAAQGRERMLEAERMCREVAPLSVADAIKMCIIFGFSVVIGWPLAGLFTANILMTGLLWLILMPLLACVFGVIAYWKTD